MHNSKCRPNNDMEIHWGRFGWRKLPIWLLPAALCQHRHKQDATHYWGSKRSSILRKKSPVERNIVRWNRRLDWIAWLLQTNLSSTVLNTKFENAHLFLSQYAGNLHTNNLWSQIILKGSSCIPAILLRVQRRILRKGKHSGWCDRTLSNTIFFECNILNLK